MVQQQGQKMTLNEQSVDKYILFCLFWVVAQTRANVTTFFFLFLNGVVWVGGEGGAI